jgi:protein-tyrosine phosphatase
MQASNRKGSIRILFVCLGNICRSPTAEGVLRQLLSQEAPALSVEVDSAGTANYHAGDPPDLRSQRAALRRGIDMSGLRARQVVAEDFTRFDLILAMDRDNLEQLRSMRPKGSMAQLRLFLEYAHHLGRIEVPDPYYGGEHGFEEVLDLTTAAARGLIASLQQRAQQPVQAARQGDRGGEGEDPGHQKVPHRGPLQT